MAVIVVGTEKNFAALKPRLLGGRASRTSVREVTEAVRAANPDVDLNRLEPGTILTIPDVPHVTLAGDLSFDDMTKSVLKGIAESGATILAGLAATAQGREREAAAERKKLRASLEAFEVGALAGADAAFKADLTAVQQAVQTADEEAKARTVALRKAREEWTADLETLKEMVS